MKDRCSSLTFLIKFENKDYISNNRESVIKNICNTNQNLFDMKISKPKQFDTVLFKYKSGFKDQLFNFMYCFLSNSTKLNVDFKLKAVELANRELDLQSILSKLIQYESISNILDIKDASNKSSNKNILRFRNIINIDNLQ